MLHVASAVFAKTIKVHRFSKLLYFTNSSNLVYYSIVNQIRCSVCGYRVDLWRGHLTRILFSRCTWECLATSGVGLEITSLGRAISKTSNKTLHNDVRAVRQVFKCCNSDKKCMKQVCDIDIINLFD